MKKVAILGVLMLFIQLFFVADVLGQDQNLEALSRERLAKSRAKLEEARRVAAQRGWMIRGVGPDGREYELQELAPNGMPVYFTTVNRTSATSTRTDSLWPYVGGAAGEMIFQWDSGKPRLTHQEFGGRITWADVPASISYHSTHVAGTMINSGGFHTPNDPYKGMAYEADLTAYEWNSDLAEMMLEASGGMLLSNHSYSYIRGWYYQVPAGIWMWYGDVNISTTEDYLFGFYSERAQEMDSLANAAPNYLIVLAASNDRADVGTAAPDSHLFWDPILEEWVWSQDSRDPDGGFDGYDCLPNSGQVAKNVLTVGSADCTFFLPPPYNPEYIDMTSYSSWGPTDDGRIKPDIVGDGHRVWSSGGGADDEYLEMSGTSMAAPNITGSLALLQEAYRNRHGGTPMRAATLKALTIHTAVDVEAEGPDYEFGWGLPNFDAAHDIIVEDDEEGGLINELTLAQGDTIYLYFCRNNVMIDKTIFTLCWSDPEGTPPAPSLDPTDLMLVNDLDIRVTNDGIEYSPWILDPSNPSNVAIKGDNFRDNVERMEFTTAHQGNFIVRITHKGTLSGGSQDFSLIASMVRKPTSYHVYHDGSGDFPDITSAAAGTECGDTIFVHAGTYYEHDIIFDAHKVIIGVDGAENTIIDAQDLGRCVYLINEDTKLDGFTVMNGTKMGSGMDGYGGGILCSGEPDVYNCIIKENVAKDGGGIYSIHAATVKNCVILENTAWEEGGGFYCSNYYYPELIDCLVARNVADNDGGGVYVPNAWATIKNSTIVYNISPANGAGIHCDGNKADIDNSIIAFNQTLGTGVGVYTPASTIDIVCCDVYGNTGGNYGGGIGDQTGINNNISEDPLFCDYASDDYTIYDTSPCTPANSPCGQLIGVYDVGCSVACELEIESVQFTETNPIAGDTIYATIKVKNTSLSNPAGSFYIDYYEDRTAPPSTGQVGDQRHSVAGLAPGDSTEWTTGPITSACFANWESYFQIDTDNTVNESNESNNVSGPHDIRWQIPMQAGWPAPGNGDFHSSPAIAGLDDDPFTKEIVIGDDGGYLHALDYQGVELPGWPVNVGDSLVSSPAVGDITGDYHMEVVVGCVDGYLYAFDYQGNLLWSHNARDPMRTTPALADLDGDSKLEIVFANTDTKNGSYVHVLEGSGTAYPGSWPYYMGGPHATSPAVGNVNRTGGLEIAAVSYGMTSPSPHSEVFLLNDDGTLYSMSWPVTIDTVVMASPVIGDIATTIGSHLEIVVGGLSGEIFAISSAGGIWPSPPRVPGMIERSPALVQSDKDVYQEILVSSRYWIEIMPPFGRWQGTVTLMDNSGVISGGWPKAAGSSASAAVMPSPIAFKSRVLASSPYYGAVHGWNNSGSVVDGFPCDVNGNFYSSAAVGDVDGDGYLELVGATDVDSIYCYDLSCSSNYLATPSIEWPFFRNDRTRCGCYYVEVISGVEDKPDITPIVTALRSIYPNPFNPITRISFDLAKRTHVHIAVYDVTGRRVCVVKDAVMNEGSHEVVWNARTDSGRPAASGVYFCRMIADDVVQSKKMVLLK